jgi:hypothetical protein
MVCKGICQKSNDFFVKKRAVQKRTKILRKIRTFFEKGLAFFFSIMYNIADCEEPAKVLP